MRNVKFSFKAIMSNIKILVQYIQASILLINMSLNLMDQK